MRMRTLPEAIKKLKADDPDTAITYWGLRQKVLTGEVPSVNVGRKRLIDLDRLSDYLTPTAIATVTPITSGAIRRVNL